MVAPLCLCGSHWQLLQPTVCTVDRKKRNHILPSAVQTTLAPAIACHPLQWLLSTLQQEKYCWHSLHWDYIIIIAALHSGTTLFCARTRGYLVRQNRYDHRHLNWLLGQKRLGNTGDYVSCLGWQGVWLLQWLLRLGRTDTSACKCISWSGLRRTGSQC